MDKQQRKLMIQQAFDTVARGYDHPALSFFPETAKRLVDHLHLDPADQLLDVCTGTGVVAIAAARKLVAGKVTGIDLSSGMLQRARAKAAEQQLHNIEFIQTDMEQLDFPPHHFDVITGSFALFFMEDMQGALSHILSMLKPGGKIAISGFAAGAFAPMSDIFLQRYQSFGREIPDQSWQRLSTGEAIQSLFRDVGIDRVQLYQEPLGYFMQSAQDWWDIVWNAGYRGLLNQLSPQEQNRFKQQHMKEIDQLCASQQVWLDTGVNIAIAEKP